MLMIRVQRLVFCSALIASFFLTGSSATAAACSTSGTIGSVTMSTNIPASGEYIVWVRMQQAVPAANDVALVEVDGANCFSLGSANNPANTWQWINYQGSSQTATMRHTFSSSGSKSIKVFSKAYDVKIDKIILMGTGEQCASNGATPSGDGANCASGPAVVVGGSNGDSTPAPVTPSIVTSNPEKVKRVEYFVNGELVQSADRAEEFDVSGLENGEYTLTTKVTYDDGTTEEVSQAVVVQNDTSLLGMTTRWMYKHRSTIFLVAGGIAAAGVFSGAYFGLRFYKHRKLYLQHHGLSHG